MLDRLLVSSTYFRSTSRFKRTIYFAYFSSVIKKSLVVRTNTFVFMYYVVRTIHSGRRKTARKIIKK